ncbi:MAG: outer membrane lipoprotein-sorting protein [Desulfobacterales bacterium]|nr:outer membrane lipoprotein-sorting protein [Desulfobacterales bacterium]
MPAVCVSIFIGLFLSATASAYVLSGSHLLDRMTKKIQTAKSLLVKQQQIFYGPIQEENHQGQVVIEETLRYVVPGKFRAEISNEQIQRVHVVSGGDVLTAIDGSVAINAESLFDYYKDLFLYRSRDFLEYHLLRLGVDVNVSSFGRFEGKPAYVIGAQYPDESVSQLWIEKESFLPFRWIISEKGSLFEVRYLNWGKFEKSFYPMRIEFYDNEKIVRAIKVTTVELNSNFPEGFFDVNYLKTLYQPAEKVPTTENSSDEALSEIQQAIEDFKKRYK